ncbi:MAG: GIY-YIG nuclease family protein [Candidatus Devosia phytovorans]|uniref:GIY-YIG nuclease family protein n=1 Tax=Candidatus Devosia phytovorans TaxID=3121372 RepID=A0AAJ6B032_9HYPH|nr:GIY-YIG nuclease family protein [Devosia sp.]WEK04762.1 MAG: GIY-YIG nuclease family protein [Devosia sp.]
MKKFFVYILTNKHRNVVYTGVTSNLIGRTFVHRNDLVDGFSRRYKVHDLVWYEQHLTALSAIQREKQIKKWRRAWKDQLVADFNPEWRDLYDDVARHWI